MSLGSPLGIAIGLRLLVHDALDRDDVPEVRRLNRLADSAYAYLRPGEVLAYLEWVKQFVDDGLTSRMRGDA